MSGLRFCFLTTFYPPFNFGGDGIAVRRLAAALGRRGHRVTVVHDVDAYRLVAGKDPQGDTSPPEDEGVEVVRLESGLGRLSPFLTHQSGRPIATGSRIRRILREGQFDVIHFHNISLIGGPGLLAYGKGVKVYTAHEHWLVCPTHVLWRHGREPCPARECTRCVLRTGRPPQAWRYTGYLKRQLDHVDLFLAVSEFSREKHREFGFPREMEVLPYFLPDLDERALIERPSLHERPYFLFVGRLERIKGLDDVIPAFERFQEADLLIAGNGSHAPALRALARDNPRVRFLGHVDPDDLPTYYRHALGLLVPSVCYETFGIILIEAFRQSVPVIARRIGPLPEIVEQAGGGELFQAPDELVASMDRFLNVPGLRERYGQRASEGFRTHWSEDVIIPRYLELVHAASRGKGRSRTAALLQHEVGT